MSLDNLLITDRRKILEINDKTKESVEKDIDIILKWFQTQKHLPETLSKNAIERILVISKFSIEKTKKICDIYYTARTLIPDVFSKCIPTLPEQKIYMDEILYYIPMPKLSSDFYRVNIIKFRDFDYPTYNPVGLVAHVMIIFEVMLQEELSMGDIIVMDMKHIRKSHILRTTPMHIKLLHFFLEQIWASRVKAIHFVNVPTFAEVIISLAKSLMKKKLLDRIHIQDNYEKLLEHVSKENLPKDYGGDEKTLDELNELWKLKLQAYGSHFEELKKIQVNEALRPEPLVNSELWGYYGNFKKIEVD